MGDVAEAAITVADDMQRRGVGKALAYELARAAVSRGIRVMRAEVLDGNAAMRAILEHAGARRVGVDGDEHATDGMISYDIELAPAHVSAPFVDILRGAAQTMAMTMRRLRAE
jgi:RimJ/RimL family protein N-acetyltransferase